MKHYRYFPLVGISLLFAGLQTSCIDNEYDLDETDYTLGIETNITLPTCSTGEIYLRNFMDLEEDGVIQYIWDEELGDSIFCVRETGTADIAPIHINEIRIKKPALSEIETSINLRDILEQGEKKQNRIKVTINTAFGDQEIEVEDKTFIYDLKENDAKYAIADAKADHISVDIISVEKLGLNKVDVTFSLNLQGFPAYIPFMHLDDMALSFPDGVEISNCTFNEKVCDIENGEIILSRKGEDPIKVDEGLILKMTIDGLHTGENFIFDVNEHSATLNGEFTLHGSFRIETAEFDTEELSKRVNNLTAQEIQDFMSGNWNTLVPTTIGVKGHAEFNNDIVIKEFTGEVTHNVGKVAPIKLDDLPDFLNDEEVVLDLDNPVLLLSANHNIPSTIYTDLELKSNTCDTPVKTNEFAINEGLNLFYIADKETNHFPASFIPDGSPIDVQRIGFTGSVPALIKKIPERIDINVTPVRLHADALDISKKYDVDINYEVFAPFTFGENFKLVYSDTETGWAKDLDDLEDLNAEMLILKGKIDSNLPAQCTLTLIPLDKNGREIKALEVNSVNAKAGVKDQNFTLTIKAAEGHTLNDVLAGKNGVNQLDGIKYSARLIGANGETLKKDASIRLHSMNVSVKGTVSYDAN